MLRATGRYPAGLYALTLTELGGPAIRQRFLGASKTEGLRPWLEGAKEEIRIDQSCAIMAFRPGMKLLDPSFGADLVLQRWSVAVGCQYSLATLASFVAPGQAGLVRLETRALRPLR